MSVLIKGMDMPKSCLDCHLFKNDECILIDYEDKDICDYGDMDLSQTGICPIIGELPEKHGRLIDVNEYCALQGCDKEDDDCKNCIIRDCKTILESEE